MSIFPSACIWSCRSPIEQALRSIKITAFHYIDVAPDTLDGPGARQIQKDLGLKVSCVELDHKLPSGSSWDGKDDGAFRKSVEYLKQALQKGQSLEASTAYVGSCGNQKYLKRFGVALSELAAEAAKRGMKLCLEHVPGRALSTAKETLAFLEELGHPNLYLLLDVGHTLLSKEKPVEIIEAAGKRLGYVQLNDNDGKKDRHWALLDGLLTRDELARTLRALVKIGYEGTLGLEIYEQHHVSAVSYFSKNHNLVHRLLLDIEKEKTK